MPSIVVRSLTKRYGTTVAVDDVSFEAGSGRVTGFLGPNGAGKSTTLRVLLGLVPPTSGSATIGGRPYRELEAPSRVVGAVLESPGFHPGRSATDHLRALAIAAGLPLERVEHSLDLVGLADDARRRVGGYSLGMRQRLAIAAALLGEPPVLIFDEPANGLDPQGIRWLRRLLRTRADAGETVLLSSHVLAEVAQLVDEVIVLHRGRLVAQAPVGELTRSAGAAVRVHTPHAERLAELLTARGAQVERPEPDWLVATEIEPHAVGDLAADHRLPVYELAVETPTLEDAFVLLTDDVDGPDPGVHDRRRTP